MNEEEQWRGVKARSLADAATTFEMSKADLEQWGQIFQPPGAIEFVGSPSQGGPAWARSQARVTAERPGDSLLVTGPGPEAARELPLLSPFGRFGESGWVCAHC